MQHKLVAMFLCSARLLGTLGRVCDISRVYARNVFEIAVALSTDDGLTSNVLIIFLWVHHLSPNAWLSFLEKSTSYFSSQKATLSLPSSTTLPKVQNHRYLLPCNQICMWSEHQTQSKTYQCSCTLFEMWTHKQDTFPQCSWAILQIWCSSYAQYHTLANIHVSYECGLLEWLKCGSFDSIFITESTHVQIAAAVSNNLRWLITLGVCVPANPCTQLFLSHPCVSHPHCYPSWHS